VLRGLHHRPLKPFLDLSVLAQHYPAKHLDGRPLEGDEYAAVRAVRGDRVDQEVALERSDGTPCVILDVGMPVYDNQGRIVAGVATVLDITARREAEGKRDRLLEETKRALHARQQMIAAVAHDLRNPLAAVELSASQLLRMAPTGETARIAVHAQRILRATRAMEQLARDLLEFTRIEMRGRVLELGEYEIRGLLEEALDMFAPLADDVQIHLRGEVERLAAQLVRCDRARVLRVLSNLMGNAFKFTRPGGTVAIGGLVEGEQAIVYVADEGPGIPGEDFPRIFDAYWQGRGPDAPKGGVGLGLAIAKGILEAHDGRIWVESIYGQGATFFFSLPIARSSRSRADPAVGITPVTENANSGSTT
jgi:signal transduction histidine kinase